MPKKSECLLTKEEFCKYINFIKDLLNIDINYYIRVNFTTLEKVIDSLGGIDVYSEYSFISYIDNIQFYKGYNHMNAKQARAF